MEQPDFHKASAAEAMPRPNDNEQHFLSGIDRLHKEGAAELARRWEAAYDKLSGNSATGAELDRLFEEFDTFRDKRESALASMETAENLPPDISEEIRSFDKDVLSSFRNATLFQGNGATAEVYAMIGHPEICIKFIVNQERYDEGNHIRTEFRLLNAMRDVRSGRIRVPMPYFLRIHAREGHSYGMECIHGKSLSQIIEKPHENSDLVTFAKELPRNAIQDEFVQFIQRMHELEITHNDIRLRNIMLDHDGNFYLIDFGKAQQDEESTMRDMHQESDFAALKQELRYFFEEIDKI